MSPGSLRLAEACAARGLAAEIVSVGGVAARASAARDRPVAVLVRLPSGTPHAECARLAALAEGSGSAWHWFDDPRRLPAVHDKAWALARLAAAGLPVPASLCVSRDEPGDPAGLHGARFVVKPRTGSSGRGVQVGLPLDTALAHARAFAETSGPTLVQGLVGDGVDHRVFIGGGRVLAGMRRVPRADDGRGNTHRGAAAEAWTPRSEHERLALDAAAALGLGTAGVDLVFDGERAVVLEVNACPGFAALEATTGLDVAGALVDACVAHVGRGATG